MERNIKEEKDLIKEEVWEMSGSGCMNSNGKLGRESPKSNYEAKITEIGKDLLEKNELKRDNSVQVKSEPIEEDTSEEDIIPISYCEIGEYDIQVKSEDLECNSHQTDDYCDDIMHGEDYSKEEYQQKGPSQSNNGSYCQIKEILAHKATLQGHIRTHTDKKRSRKSVTLGTKLEVLRRIEAGEKIVEICKTMGLAKSTIQTIRNNKEDIKTYFQSAAPLNASRLTRQRNWIMEKMEKLLIIWIQDNNKKKIPLSVMTIQEKALHIFENLKNGDTDESAEDVTFQASRGWFEKFKNRFHLNNLKVKGEAVGFEEVISMEYPNISRGVIERDVYKPEQVLYVGETGKLVSFVSKQLTSKHLSKAFSHFEQGIKIFLENDPDFERSSKVSREIFSAISCYKSLKKDIDKEARQTILNNFVKPCPSFPAKKNDDSEMQVTIASSSLD